MVLRGLPKSNKSITLKIKNILYNRGQMTSQYCPSCLEEVVLNTGSEECEYAIVEEFPESVLPTPSMQSKWAKDEWTPKKILMNELDKIGMVIQQFRIITVYPHLPPESGIPIENCYDSGFGRMLSEIQNKKGVICVRNSQDTNSSRFRDYLRFIQIIFLTLAATFHEYSYLRFVHCIP
jgi:hypothetical protein